MKGPRLKIPLNKVPQDETLLSFCRIHSDTQRQKARHHYHERHQSIKRRNPQDRHSDASAEGTNILCHITSIDAHCFYIDPRFSFSHLKFICSLFLVSTMWHAVGQNQNSSLCVLHVFYLPENATSASLVIGKYWQAFK